MGCKNTVVKDSHSAGDAAASRKNPSTLAPHGRDGRDNASHNIAPNHRRRRSSSADDADGGGRKKSNGSTPSSSNGSFEASSSSSPGLSGSQTRSHHHHHHAHGEPGASGSTHATAASVASSSDDVRATLPMGATNARIPPCSGENGGGPPHERLPSAEMDSGDSNERAQEPILENHFDPIAASTSVAGEEGHKDGAVRPQPAFHTRLDQHDKTDAAQAAEEYQARVQAKKDAEEAKAARMQVEIFDPIRPVDSFNVTHRALLGRCWDRRVPEVAPISFVHTVLALEAADATEEEEDEDGAIGRRCSSCGGLGARGNEKDGPEDGAHHPLYEPFSAVPPAHGASARRRSGEGGNDVGVFCACAPQRRNSNVGISGAASVPDFGAAIGAGGVPRRSHWFSVIGISTNLHITSPTRTLAAASPTSYLLARSNSLADVGGGATLELGSPATTTTVASYQELVKQYPAWPRVEDIMKLSLNQRVDLANKLMACNSRYYGMKNTYAFRVSEEEVPEDEEVADAGLSFLRRCGLSPARGVKVARWNRVEFFSPNFVTLTKAVAKTEGIAELTAATIPRTGPRRGNGSRDRDIDMPSSPSSPRASHNPMSGGRGKVSNNGSALSLDSDTAPPLPSLRAAAYVSRHVSNLSFVGQHLISNGENFSFTVHSAAAATTTASNGSGANSSHTHGSPNGSFLHRSLLGQRSRRGQHTLAEGKGGDTGGWGIAAHSGALTATKSSFPEDSVLCLAMEVPPTRMVQLPGVPQRARLAATSLLLPRHSPSSTTSANNGVRNFPTTTADDHGHARPLRSTQSLSSTGSRSSPVTAHPRSPTSTSSPSPSSPPPAGTESLIIALTISSFSVSIDPFRWDENKYTRYPVDVDGYKSASRRDYGEGVITDIMYGGVLVIECSCTSAVTHLLSLLRGMKWTENRTPAAIIGDVKKRVKQYRKALLKRKKGDVGDKTPSPTHDDSGPEDDDDVATVSGASADGNGRTSHTHTTTSAGAEEAAAANLESFQYRISRRIGGRQMRDAVELKQISVYLGDTIVEQSQTLSLPQDGHKEAAGSSAGSPNTAAEQQLDPDTTPSFSRVASAWVGLPAISAVVRTWGMHLLCNPQFAQPISFFLQRFSGVAPVVQHTALSSLFHLGGTPTDPSLGESNRDDERIRFFESDVGGGYSARADSDDLPHMPPAKRISKFNPFYASLPVSEISSPTEANTGHLTKSASQETIALGEPYHNHQDDNDDNDDGETGAPGSVLKERSCDTLPHPAAAEAHHDCRWCADTAPASPSNALPAGDEDAVPRNETIDDSVANEGEEVEEEEVSTLFGCGKSDTFVYTDSADHSATSPGTSSATHPTVSSSSSLPPPPLLPTDTGGFGSNDPEGSGLMPPPPLLRTRNPHNANGGDKAPPRSSTILKTAPPSSSSAAVDTPRGSTTTTTTKRGNKPAAGRNGAANVRKVAAGTAKAATKASGNGGGRSSQKPPGGTNNNSKTRSKDGVHRNKATAARKQASPTTSTSNSTAVPPPPPPPPPPLSTSQRQLPALLGNQQEMENLWSIAALEVKAQQQELADVQAACLKAEEHQGGLLEELHVLHKAFLPNTTAQELDLVFLYLKTALFEPEDLPNSRVYLNSADWLPMLTALWTSPANSNRSVEVAYPLQSHHLPKIGMLSGLLFHKFAAGPLEHLEINAKEMLGSAGLAASRRAGTSAADTDSVATRQGSTVGIGGGGGAGAAEDKGKKKRPKLFARSGTGKRGRKPAHTPTNDTDEASEYEPLVFSFPAAGQPRNGSSLAAAGPGTYSPPFYVSPEQARDTLWLLLCAIADSTSCVEFRLCLRGFPTTLPPKEQERVRREEAEQNQRAASSVAHGGADGDSPPRGGGKVKLSASFTDFFARHKRTANLEPHHNHNNASVPSTFQLREDTLNLNSFVVNTSIVGVADGSSSGSPVQTYAVFSHFMSRVGSYVDGDGETPNIDPEPPQKRDVAKDGGGSGAAFVHEASVALPPVGSGAPYQHTHTVRRRPWMHAGACALVLPFYTILFHPCSDLCCESLAAEQGGLQQRIATACREQGLTGALLSLSDAAWKPNPPISHYHNQYTVVHNNDDFYIPPARQRKLAELAVKAALAREAMLSSVRGLPGGVVWSGELPLSPLAIPGSPDAHQRTAAAGQQPQGDDGAGVADGLRASWGMSDLCLSNLNVFGLMSAAEEAAVYAEEDLRLLRHSDEIWAVLRRATQHFNQAPSHSRSSSTIPTPAPAPSQPAKAKDRKSPRDDAARTSKWRRAIILERW